MNLQTLNHLAASSGGTLYLMGLLLLVALTVIVERSWYLFRLMAGGRAVNERVASLPRLRDDLLQKELAAAAQLPHAALLGVVLSHAEVNDRCWPTASKKPSCMKSPSWTGACGCWTPW